jgi:hypothetical protein
VQTPSLKASEKAKAAEVAKKRAEDAKRDEQKIEREQLVKTASHILIEQEFLDLVTKLRLKIGKKYPGQQQKLSMNHVRLLLEQDYSNLELRSKSKRHIIRAAKALIKSRKPLALDVIAKSGKVNKEDLDKLFVGLCDDLDQLDVVAPLKVATSMVFPANDQISTRHVFHHYSFAPDFNTNKDSKKPVLIAVDPIAAYSVAYWYFMVVVTNKCDKEGINIK